MSAGRLPLPREEIALFEGAGFSAEECSRLLRFYRSYQERNLAYFVSLRRLWTDRHRGQRFPGLCANVHPLTGELRPDAEQRLWGWGDTRALATWCSFLAADRVPAKQVTLEGGGTVDLREALSRYADLLWEALAERYRLNGRIPFTADLRTNLADDHPANRASPEGPDITSMFAANAFVQYGLWRGDAEALALGTDLLEKQLRAVAGASLQRRPGQTHGPWMILLGVIVEIRRNPAAARLGESLAGAAMPLVDHILADHYREDGREVGAPGRGAAFWERSDGAGGPAADPSGSVVVDPGHATELSGFLAELTRFLEAEARGRVLAAALNIHLFADRIGFTPAGAMSKLVELSTGRFLPDTQAAAASQGPARPTAPWWNVREHSAAALRLYTLTRDERLVESYRRAQRASYLFYPSLRIGGQMIQTIDPFTLEPLDIAPATGNLDPMHDARSRVREIECLEELLAGA